jgi:uncharacterized phage-associated protein
MISFRVNKIKTVNALLFLIGKANERGYEPSQYDLVKSLFFADRAHLNRYGRPVTFDSYFAMTHGPVPSFAYDALKNNFNWRSVDLDAAPWNSVRKGKVHRFSIDQQRPELRTIAASDQQALANALSTVMSLSFGQIRKITHEDRAYVAAWRDEEDCSAFPMNMELLLDDASDDAVDDIRYLAEMTGE